MSYTDTLYKKIVERNKLFKQSNLVILSELDIRRLLDEVEELTTILETQHNFKTWRDLIGARVHGLLICYQSLF